jgi:hypothetical protein
MAIWRRIEANHGEKKIISEIVISINGIMAAKKIMA